MQKLTGCLLALTIAACASPNGTALETAPTPAAKNDDTGSPLPAGTSGKTTSPAPTTDDPNTDSPTLAFHKGDAFDYGKVRAPSQMIVTMLASFGYASSAAPRAVAVNADGLGYVAVKPAAAQQAEAEQAALQACYVIGGAKPCVLLATAGAFAIDETDLAKPTFVLDAPTALANVPFALAVDAKIALQRYSSIGGKKAIAVSLDGLVVPAPTASGITAASDAEASRIALETCEMQAVMAPCTIFAVGNAVAFDPKAANAKLQVPYANTTVKDEVPGLSLAIFTSAIKSDYLANVNGGKQGAIFISRDGNGGYAYGNQLASAQTTARTNCAANASSADACVLYATGSQVVFKPSSIVALAVGGQELACKATPRLDCSQHASIGCAAGGRYYTTHAGGVKLEDCP